MKIRTVATVIARYRTFRQMPILSFASLSWLYEHEIWDKMCSYGVFIVPLNVCFDVGA